MRLHNRVALITGAGRGIGRTIALLFASEGANVVVAGPTEQTINSVVGEIADMSGNAMAVEVDVADEPSVDRMVARTLSHFGGLDILVNNAGIIGPTAPVASVSLDEWNQTLAVNLTGAFLCSRASLHHMMEQRAGRIINITSIAGLIGYALRSPYAVSKWGMIGLTRTLALEVGAYDITVNAIAPGPVRGPRIDEVIRRRGREMDLPIDEVERTYVEPIALKRMIEEDDVARVALFLASDEGRNITGETINVSGGYRL